MHKLNLSHASFYFQTNSHISHFVKHRKTHKIYQSVSRLTDLKSVDWAINPNSDKPYY